MNIKELESVKTAEKEQVRKSDAKKTKEERVVRTWT